MKILTFKIALASVALFVASYRNPSRVSAAPVPTPDIELKLPLKAGSLKFAAIGDSGTGDPEQYEVAQRMVEFRKQFQFEFVVMLGDNIYGSHTPDDFRRKFEEPYKPLLDGGVKFYASLGNHDDPSESLYKFFNMDGKRYYSFHKGDVDFFVLDSNYLTVEQTNWLRQELPKSKAAWKICYFHHPLYSDAKFHGSDVDLRNRLEPIFRDQGVDVVLSGHEHVYERLVPQFGIYYFVLGNSGQLRPHDLKVAKQTAKGFDTDRSFAAFEVSGNELSFQVISRTGQTVDSGTITHRETPARP